MEEAERAIEERLSENPSDAEALRALMEVKIRARKIGEAIGVIDRLTEIEPKEIEWPLLYIYNDDHETAKKLFEEIMKNEEERGKNDEEEGDPNPEIGYAVVGGGKQEKKNGAAEGRNRRALGDIGNLVTLRGR